MANPFQIVITAVDGATKTIKKINTAFGAVTRPVSKSVKSMSTLGKVGTSSLKSLTKGLNDVSKAGGGTAKVLEWLALPAALTGIGALATTFGNFGFSLNLTSKLLDLNAQDLTRWHYAAKMAGTSAEAFDQAYSGAQDSIRNAAFGGDPYGKSLLNKMGVNIEKNADGTVKNYEKVFTDIIAAAQTIKSIPGQREFLSHFGMGALTPMVQRGRIGEDRAAAGNKGILTNAQIAMAEKFRNDIDALGSSIEGLKNQIGAQLAPVLDPLVNAFAAWLDTNRVEIARQLGVIIGQIADWIKSIDWKQFKTDVEAAWQAIGGLKGVLIGLGLLTFSGPIGGVMKLAGALLSLGAFMILNPIGMVITLLGTLGGLAYLLYQNWGGVKQWWHDLWEGMSNDTKTNTDKINDSKKSLFEDMTDSIALWVNKLERQHGGTAATNSTTPAVVKKLMGEGMSRDAAIGTAANLWQESTYDPNAVGDKGAAYGIGQWHADRQALFKKLMGVDIHGSTLDQQLKFTALEMQQGDEGAKRAGYALPRVHSAEAAAMIVSQYYERPGDVEGEKAKRAAQAVLIEKSLGPDFGVSAPALPDAAATGKRQGAGDTASGDDTGHDARVAALQKMDISLTLHNAPPGTQAEAKHSDGTQIPTRINHSMGVSFGAMP